MTSCPCKQSAALGRVQASPLRGDKIERRGERRPWMYPLEDGDVKIYYSYIYIYVIKKKEY